MQALPKEIETEKYILRFLTKNHKKMVPNASGVGFAHIFCIYTPEKVRHATIEQIPTWLQPKSRLIVAFIWTRTNVVRREISTNEASPTVK